MLRTNRLANVQCAKILIITVTGTHPSRTRSTATLVDDDINNFSEGVWLECCSEEEEDEWLLSSIKGNNSSVRKMTITDSR